MNHYVSSQVNRSDEKGSCRSVVDYKGNSLFVGEFCYSRNIYDFQAGVSDCLSKNRLCVFLIELFKVLRGKIARVCDGNVELLKDRKKLDCSAVEAGRGNDVVTGTKEIHEAMRDGGHSRSRGNCTKTMFKGIYS